MLTKALANEVDVPVIYKSGSEYIDIGAARVHYLFKECKSYKSGSIIFIDELETIGLRRTNDLS